MDAKLTDDLIARLREDDPATWPPCDEAADALEAQARRIAELETEIGKHVMRVFALMDLLPDATLCGELQEATARRHEMPARIAELEAALKPFADVADYTKTWAENEKAPVPVFCLRAVRAAYLGEKG